MINSWKGFNGLGNAKSRKQGGAVSKSVQIEPSRMTIFLIVLVKMEKLVPFELWD
jgi:hypothetical protein